MKEITSRHATSSQTQARGIQLLSLEEETRSRLMYSDRRQTCWINASNLEGPEQLLCYGNIYVQLVFPLINYVTQGDIATSYGPLYITGDIVTLEEEVRREGLNRVISMGDRLQEVSTSLYLWELENQGVKLINPIELVLEKDDDLYTVYNIELNLSGTGLTIDDARKDFEDFLVHDFIFYSQLPADQLSPQAAKLLAYYKTILQ